MNQYYLLELISENDRIISNKLYKTEFTSPFCIIDILLDDLTKLSNTIYFVLTDNVDYLYKFFDVKYKDEYFEVCKSFYNKSNFAYGGAFYDYLYSDVIEFTIHLTSKNFNKYYSYDESGILENYNEIVCYITSYYDEKENKEVFLVNLRPLYILSRTKNNEEYIKKVTDYISFSLYEFLFDINQFKQFNTFKELILQCILSTKKQLMSEPNILTNKEKLVIINDYFDILIDIARGIEM